MIQLQARLSPIRKRGSSHRPVVQNRTVSPVLLCCLSFVAWGYCQPAGLSGLPRRQSTQWRWCRGPVGPPVMSHGAPHLTHVGLLLLSTPGPTGEGSSLGPRQQDRLQSHHDQEGHRVLLARCGWAGRCCCEDQHSRPYSRRPRPHRHEWLVVCGPGADGNIRIWIGLLPRVPDAPGHGHPCAAGPPSRSTHGIRPAGQGCKLNAH